jgi:hypothetical protein
MHSRLTRACSLCGKAEAEVSRLVACRSGYICDSCAAEAHRIMSDLSSDQSVLSATPRLWTWVATRLRRLWRYGQTFDPVAVA